MMKKFFLGKFYVTLCQRLFESPLIIEPSIFVFELSHSNRWEHLTMHARRNDFF